MEPIINVQKLQKVYTINEREAGVAAAVRSLFKRKTRDIVAVNQIDLQVGQGEIVGFLGPNGAGKTTTLKMLAGLLHPTSGSASVLGFSPWERQRPYLRQMTLVMGQRNQLVWDIPAADTFALHRVVYEIPDQTFKESLAELVELLDLKDLISKPVRNLSLGERMKCEIAGALLHRPKVLFLDEPTIGLDVTAQRKIREFVAEYNRRHEATIMLTSHYMADVEALCKRVVVIHHGNILFDGALSELVTRFSPYKIIDVEFAHQPEPSKLESVVDPVASTLTISESQLSLQVPKSETAVLTNQLLQHFEIQDLTIQDPPIDDVIDRVFQEG
ncbi:MAG: ABC transporter ATP-binding protein [Chloroflexota bacterium]